MTSDAPAFQLYLLVPWDLPIEGSVDDAEKTSLGKVLDLLLQALHQSSVQSALLLVDQGIELLDVELPELAQISSTQTPLKAWEVKDFDRYFDVVHIQSSNPATHLIQNLLVAYRMFLLLCSSGASLDLLYVKHQNQGFISYVYLLSRMFDIHLEKKEW